MDIDGYLQAVRAQYESGHATEHSYRPALHDLFKSIDSALTVINEPKKSEAGMPDFLFQRGDVPIGWTECKDIDKDVIKLKGYSIEQRKRYEKAYPNLIYTNGVDFEFIREAQSVHFVSIASFMGQLGGLQPLPDKFEELERQLKLFAEQKPISIRTAQHLAEMMAAKAAIIKDELEIALSEDKELRSALAGQFKSFKANLLPALTADEFADLYAETITYGMFAARFHDDNLATFSRQEALERLPASNPFLKGLFDYIAGPALPRRLEYIVGDLVQVMRASDPHALFRDFGKFTARNDPFVHFYETFLAAYNPKKRKSRGVWYSQFLKSDFPVIPYPPSPKVFADVAEKGEQLRRLHLMEPAAIDETPYPYHGQGDDVVAAGYPKFGGGKVQINRDQYFDGVPEIAWGFHIGGYQPAQKWLKNRRGRTLSWDDIGHYQKIVKILAETDRIMREIELPLG